MSNIFNNYVLAKKYMLQLNFEKYAGSAAFLRNKCMNKNENTRVFGKENDIKRRLVDLIFESFLRLSFSLLLCFKA